MKTKYGVTNQLAQLAKVRSPQPRYNQYGEKIGATGLSNREQMGAAQDFSFMPKKKKSKPVMGERMMFKGGGMVTAKPN
tara:strand:- start:356 stop:592 length:237 start_codon:yes stop_codon:yes gene_type:complete